MICRLRLVPNFGVPLTAGRKFHLQLTIKKMHMFAIFIEKRLRPYGCCETNFTATVNCSNPKTETQLEIIETEVSGIQILL